MIKAQHPHYDVVIIGGAMIGSSIAWFLTDHPDFDGRILIVERDPSFEFSSTARTNSCIRQQFSTDLNIRISQFGADFINGFKDYIGEPDAPPIRLQNFGYLYLAGSETSATALRQAQSIQAAAGAATRIMSPDEIAAAYPFYDLNGVVLGSHNTVDEGYFDGGTLFDLWRKSAARRGVERIEGEVVGFQKAGTRITGVQLSGGDVISCGHVVNAAGPRGSDIAAMAGVALPVAPRKRYTFIFDAAEPLERDLPLTIDPSGVHVRSDGQYYLAGCPPDEDPDVAADDFTIDHDLWESKAWPAIATRIPQFERVKLIHTWVGHYAFNSFDQNAIVGADPAAENLILANGFSGHGFQQSPAIGRGVAELIVGGGYRTLDLTPFSPSRLRENRPIIETAII